MPEEAIKNYATLAALVLIIAGYLFEKLKKRAGDADEHDKSTVLDLRKAQTELADSQRQTNDTVRDLALAVKHGNEDRHAMKERQEGYFAKNTERVDELRDWRTELNVQLKPVFADLEARTVRFDTASQANAAKGKKR